MEILLAHCYFATPCLRGWPNLQGGHGPQTLQRAKHSSVSLAPAPRLQGLWAALFLWAAFYPFNRI